MYLRIEVSVGWSSESRDRDLQTGRSCQLPKTEVDINAERTLNDDLLQLSS